MKGPGPLWKGGGLPLKVLWGVPVGWDIKKGHVTCGLRDLEAPGWGLVLMVSPLPVVPGPFILADMDLG